MKALIDLLERKNVCFRSFYKLSEAFINEISKGETQNLEEFQRKRQSLINVLEKLEADINGLLAGFNNNPTLLDAMVTNESRAKIAALLGEKDLIVKSILDLDLQILAYVDQLKSETIQKLQNLQSGMKTLNAYRSPQEAVEKAENKTSQSREA